MNTPTSLPVACTLSPQELSERHSELLPGLVERAEAVTEIENGLLLRFLPRPGLLREMAGVIEQEQTCCSFLRFEIVAEPGAGALTLQVTGPEGTRELLRSLSNQA